MDKGREHASRWLLPLACLVVGLSIVLLLRPTTLVFFAGVALLTFGALAGLRQLRTSQGNGVQ